MNNSRLSGKRGGKRSKERQKKEGRKRDLSAVENGIKGKGLPMGSLPRDVKWKKRKGCGRDCGKYEEKEVGEPLRS